jgi:hypothetical protein
LECGGKRSATPLWIEKERPSANSGSQPESGVALRLPPNSKTWRCFGLVLSALLIALSTAALGAESEDKARFSDQPAPLQLEGFPERPPLLLELGDKFLSTGNLHRGFTLPTGANWTPNLWVYGTLRSAVQTFDDGGNGTRTSEWANRLDLFANLQFSATERILVGFRPVDQNSTPARFSGYQFEPVSAPPGHKSLGDRGWVDAFSATPRTFFFEGEFGEIFPKLDQHDKRNFDYGFAVGRQSLTLQDGILANDDSIDMFSISRIGLRVPGGSTLRLTGYYAWDQIERADNARDKGASLFGLEAIADFPVCTVDADLAYVTSTAGGDGFYAGIGSNQRIGKFNTVFRANTSVAVDHESDRVRNGTLLFGECSYTMPYGEDLVYLNGFWGIDHFSSADRAPSAGGPLGRVGILNAAVGLGRYGAPLSNQADNAVGGALGYQMFFGELKRKQLILELGGRAPTRAPTLLRQQPAEGIGARYQQAFGRRLVVILDTFGVLRENSEESWGGRLEFLVKF